MSKKTKKTKKPKPPLTSAERRARRERKKNTMIIFINGKQKRVPRPQLIEGMPVDEFLARNADPMWLHMNEMWELMPSEEDVVDERGDLPSGPESGSSFDATGNQ